MKNLALLLTFIPLTIWGSINWESKIPGGFSAKVQISKKAITVEEDLTLTLTLLYPNTYTPDLDTIRMNLLKYVGLSEPPFALVEESIEQQKGRLSATFTLEPQIASLQFISLYNIPFLPNNGDSEQTIEIISDIFQIEIRLPEIETNYYGLSYPLLSLTEQFPITLSATNRKNLIENTQLHKLESLRSVQIINHRTLPWANLLGAFLFILILLIARMQPKKQPDLKKQRKKIALSAKEKALVSLEEISTQSLTDENYYTGLNNTVRKYIEERFQLKTTTQTTQEFLYLMASHPAFDRETQAMLSDFMISSDKIKFAEQTPTEEECALAKQTAHQFINQSS